MQRRFATFLHRAAPSPPPLPAAATGFQRRLFSGLDGDGDREGKPLAVQFADVAQASYRIKGAIRHTSCLHSVRCSQLTGMDLYFKEDMEQLTGSFKERGARNALLELGDAQRATGVITASAGTSRSSIHTLH